MSIKMRLFRLFSKLIYCHPESACDSLDVVLRGGSKILFSNSTIDTSKVAVLDLSLLAVGWHLNITVTDGTAPVEGAEVKVIPTMFPSYVIRDELTDAEGKAFFNVPEYVIARPNNLISGVIPIIQYSIEVTRGGFALYTGAVQVTQNTDVDIILTGVAGRPEAGIPDRFTLNQNYTNPFNPETRINYQIPEACHVKIQIYNIMGELVKTIVDEHQSAGYKVVNWNATDRYDNAVSSGIYLYMMKAGDFKSVKRMLYLR